ncbi:MAG: hypothetical protein WA280_03235 [Xanthobacteraceae bacterium]
MAKVEHTSTSMVRWRADVAQYLSMREIQYLLIDSSHSCRLFLAAHPANYLGEAGAMVDRVLAMRGK